MFKSDAAKMGIFPAN